MSELTTREQRLVGVGADDVWVEVGAAGLLKPADRVVEAERVSIGSVRDHRVERVDHGDDASAEGDLVAFQPPGVPRAIKALVVVQCEEARLLEARKQPQDRPAVLGVLVHLRLLGRR